MAHPLQRSWTTSDNDAEGGRHTRSADALLDAALDDVELRLGECDLCAAATARRLGISVSYLTKLFARRGTSYGRWVQRRRMERAWLELRPGRGDRRTVSEVAGICGFADSGHFARVFRAHFGITPTQRRSGGVRGLPQAREGTITLGR